MGSVRAKFKCDSITRTMGSMPTGKKNERGYDEYAPCEMWTVKMTPVYANGDPNHENSKFWAASLGGSLELTCVNAAAVACFDIGKEFYLDFTPASPGSGS